jgi:putative peptidoglycan lipid II flippase
LLLTQLLNLFTVPQMGAAGLAVSIGVAALVNAGWLLRGLVKSGAYQPASGWRVFGAKVGLAAAAMGSLLALLALQVDWLALGKAVRMAWMAASIAGASALYLGVLLVLRVDLRQLMRRRAQAS